MDLATETYYKIDKDKCLDFETENIVLYLPISEYSNTEYLKRFYELAEIKPKFMCVICGLYDAVVKRPDGIYVLPITALKP